VKPSPLRSDPDAVRAWKDRSRERQIERVREAASSSPSESTLAHRFRKKVQFRPSTSASDHPCEPCARRGRKQQACHWHHWLEQEQLRIYARGQRLGVAETRALVRGLINDRRNFSPVCRECHGTGKTHGHRFVFADVPPSAFAFALELGQEWFERLRREYPLERAA
jgi:hypothetical protein